MLANYLKLALAVLRRRKFFTFVSLFGISFTLAVLLVVTALLDSIVNGYPPETNLERTLGVRDMVMMSPDGKNTWQGPAGYGLLDKYVRTLPSAEKVSILSAEAYWVAAYKNGSKFDVGFKYTDGEFWQILDFQFLEGAAFTADDEKNANFVAVISKSLRERYFGEANAVGKTIEIDGQRFRVIGVVPDVPVYRFTPFADIWVPISTSKSTTYKNELMGGFQAIILAKNAGDFPAIKAEFREALKHAQFPDPKEYNQLYGGADTVLESIARMMFQAPEFDTHVERLVAIFFTLMLLFMLLPAINLVNLNVSRIMERASEIGVRKAFGASRVTLVGQFVTENLVLTLCGGLIGFILSIAVLHFLNTVQIIPYGKGDFHINGRIFFYGMCIITFFGLFSGVYPAWKMSRLNPVQALKGGV